MEATQAWTPDDYGTLNLHPVPGAHAWIQGRRPYCDRGHWEWGATGVPADHRLAPSYYFMRLDVAQAEVEGFLARALFGESPVLANAHLLQALPGQTLHPDQPDWHWVREGEGLVAVAGGARLRISPFTAPGAQDPSHALVEAQGVDSLDASDRFPRLYLDAANAIAEVRDFLAWRLRREPAQVPGMLAAPRPVGPVLRLPPRAPRARP